jgi:hypothetical protein
MCQRWEWLRVTFREMLSSLPALYAHPTLPVGARDIEPRCYWTDLRGAVAHGIPGHDWRPARANMQFGRPDSAMGEVCGGGYVCMLMGRRGLPEAEGDPLSVESGAMLESVGLPARQTGMEADRRY